MVSAIPTEVVLARLSDDDRAALARFRRELRKMLGARLVDPDPPTL